MYHVGMTMNIFALFALTGFYSADAVANPAYCVVSIQDCPANPSSAFKVRFDTYNGSNTNTATCMKRAGEFKSWCKARQQIVAKSYDADFKWLQSKIIEADAGVANTTIARCHVKTENCPKTASKTSSSYAKDDAYNGANTNFNSCMFRAEETKAWCATSAQVSATAYTATNVKVGSHIAPATAQFAKCESIAHTCPKTGNWGLRKETVPVQTANECMEQLTRYRTEVCGEGPRLEMVAYDENGQIVKSAVSEGYTLLSEDSFVGGPIITGPSTGRSPAKNIPVFTVQRTSTESSDTAAFQRAINNIKKTKLLGKIKLEAKKYYIDCASTVEWRACLQAYDISTGLIIEGTQISDSQRTEIIIQNTQTGFLRVKSSSNVYLADLVIDHAEPASTQGTIESIENGSFIVRKDNGFAFPTDTRIFNSSSTGGSFGVVLNSQTLAVKDFLNNYLIIPLDHFSRVDDVRFRVTLPSGTVPRTFAAGDRFIYGVRNSIGGAMIAVADSTNIGLANITIHSAASAATGWQEVHGRAVLYKLKLLRKAPRIVTSSGDAIWTKNCTARFYILNSEFEGMMDDAVNFASAAHQPLQGTSSSSILVNPNYEKTVFPLLRSANAINSTVVQAVSKVNQWQRNVGTVDSAKINGEALEVKLVNGTQSTPDDMVFFAGLSAPGSIVANNKFRTFRGVLRPRSMHSIFYRNSFASPMNARFFMHVDVQQGNFGWSEGPGMEALDRPQFFQNTVNDGSKPMFVSPQWTVTTPVN